MKIVYLTDDNANADWSMNDEMKSLLLEHGHEPGLLVTNAWSWKTRQWEGRK